MEHTRASAHCTNLQKYICKFKQLAKLCEITFLYKNNKKSEKELDKLTFGNSEFVESKICDFHQPYELSVFYLFYLLSLPKTLQCH